jgi:hypothetical protein
MLQLVKSSHQTQLEKQNPPPHPQEKKKQEGPFTPPSREVVIGNVLGSTLGTWGTFWGT